MGEGMPVTKKIETARTPGWMGIGETARVKKIETAKTRKDSGRGGVGSVMPREGTKPYQSIKK